MSSEQFYLDIPLDRFLPRARSEAHHFAAGLQTSLEVTREIALAEQLDVNELDQAIRMVTQVSKKVDEVFVQLAKAADED